jgi:hypothetical protein
MNRSALRKTKLARSFLMFDINLYKSIMRFLGIILLSFLWLNFSSCSSAQKASEEKTLLKMDSLKNTAKKLYLFRNKKLEIASFNGGITYKMVDNEKTSVVRFSYEKDMDKVAFDGGYREEIIFEVPNTVSEQNYTDAQLQDTKMLFGRYCFCRGQTGLYKVNQGRLHLTLSKKEIHFELQFKMTEVPQITTEIKQ